MKKTVRKLVIVVAMAFSVVGLGGTVAAAAGVITWNGTSNYQELMINMVNIGKIATDNKTKADNANEQLTQQSKDNDNVIKDKDKVIKDKDKVIKNKEAELETKKKELTKTKDDLEQLKTTSKTESDKLKQAEQDMKTAKDKSAEILNGLK